MYQVIEKLMQEHNESIAQLSRATEIPINVITNWKYRNGGPSYKNAKKLAKHYDVPVETFFKEDE